MSGWWTFNRAMRTVVGNVGQVLRITVGPTFIVAVLIADALYLFDLPLDVMSEQNEKMPQKKGGEFVVAFL